MPGRNPDEIVAAVLRATPHLPAAPELLQVHPQAALVGRLHAALGFAPMPTGSAAQDRRAVPAAPAGGLDPEMPLSVAVDPVIDAGLVAMTHALDDGAEQIVKVQTIGPVTAQLALERLGVDRNVARRLAARHVRERTIAMIEWLAETRPLVTPLVTFDEPGLATLTSNPSPLAVADAIDAMAAAAGVVENFGLSGVHCCGSTDWSSVFQAGFDVVNAPLDAGVERLPGALNAFLVRGGWMCWGAVPTHQPLGPHGEHSWKRLADRWCGLVRDGVHPLRLRTQALVSPECGLALHGEPQAAQVLDVVGRLGQRIHEQVVAVRFAVGA